MIFPIWDITIFSYRSAERNLWLSINVQIFSNCLDSSYNKSKQNFFYLLPIYVFSKLELLSPKGVGFVIYRNELNGLLESYSFSKRLTFRSPYGRMMMNYWLSNLSSLFTKEIPFYLKIRGEKNYCFLKHFITKFIPSLNSTEYFFLHFPSPLPIFISLSSIKHLL